MRRAAIDGPLDAAERQLVAKYGGVLDTLLHAVPETDRSGAPGTIDLGEVAREAFADIGHYVILKDHVPPWDQHRTGAVVLGRTLAEAVGRALFIHEVLQP